MSAIVATRPPVYHPIQSFYLHIFLQLPKLPMNPIRRKAIRHKAHPTLIDGERQLPGHREFHQYSFGCPSRLHNPSNPGCTIWLKHHLYSTKSVPEEITRFLCKHLPKLLILKPHKMSRSHPSPYIKE